MDALDRANPNPIVGAELIRAGYADAANYQAMLVLSRRVLADLYDEAEAKV